MKVLFLSNVPCPYRMDFFNELGKYCDLTVVMQASSVPQLNKEWLESFVVENFTYKIMKCLYSSPSVRINPTFFTYLKKNQYDLIVVGEYYSPTGMAIIEYLRMRKIPFIFNSDGGMVKADDGLRRKMKTHFIGSAEAWLSTGKTTSEYLLHYGAKKEKIYKYPFTSVRMDDILEKPVCREEKEAIRRKLNIKEKKIVISVGQFIYRKGYDILLRACANMDKDIGVFIIGGNASDEYLELKERLKLNNVHFIDFKKKQQLSLYYKMADLFVLPTREDIWGLVINEAMAYALPVITTDKCVAGLELIENGKNGFLVPVENSEIIKEKIELILTDEKLKTEMSENNLERIKEYTIESMAKRHMEIFEDVIKKINKVGDATCKKSRLKKIYF